MTVDSFSVYAFSYAMGIAQTKGLKTFLQTNVDIDTIKYINDFVRGMKDMQEKMNDPKMKAYSMGLQIAQQVFGDFPQRINQQITGKQDTTFLNLEEYKKGFMSVMTNEPLPLSVDSASRLCQKQMEYYYNEKLERDYGQNRKDGEEFLAQNAKLAGVKTTPSGLQYEIIKQGTGPIPQKDSQVKVNYKGTLIDGTIFDTTEGKTPFQTNVAHVIKGWTEALTMMPVGSKWKIYVPYDLAYGNRETGKIKPFSALIFEIELLEIVELPKSNPTAPATK
jgi:FKBP-type peptidyl-prolyl cis-trans isomerase FklB